MSMISDMMNCMQISLEIVLCPVQRLCFVEISCLSSGQSLQYHIMQ